MRQAALLLGLGVLAVGIYACDDDVEPTAAPSSSDGGEGGTAADGGGGGDGAGGTDGSTETDSSTTTDAAADTGTDSGIPPGCTDAELEAAGADKTGMTSVTITFPNGAAPQQYNPRCVKIKVGSSVSWDGKFESHPLTPFGGDTPNPIPSVGTTPDGGVVTVTFSTTGTFGFRCDFHNTAMTGAVKVVP